MSKYCRKCQKQIDCDNISLCMKFFGNDTDVFFCYDCLAKENDCEVEQLMDIVMNYRKMGCMMFTPLEEIHSKGKEPT